MTKIGCGLALAVLFASGCDDKGASESFAAAREDIARLEVRKLANEAYAQWAASTGKDCPTRLEELGAYVDRRDMRDVWGTEMTFKCDATAKTFRVISFGLDKTEGTSDDIVSK